LTNGDPNLPSISHEHKNSLSSTADSMHNIPSSIDSQLSKVHDFSQPISNSTRLESLKLITEAFRRFSTIESTLSAQRKQSQMTTSINPPRSRFNSTTNSNYNKTIESPRTTRTQTQS
jgi:hypothetical protein